MEIKKMVELLPEQYIELLRNGQVEINGQIKTKEEGVIYNTGFLEFIEKYNKIMEAEYQQYEVKHTPMAMKSLEQEYEELTAEGGKASKDVSAIGYTAIIKSGNTIKVTEPNTGDFYINGERVTNDYTFNGEGYEIVNVWVFESNSGDLSYPPSVTDTHNLTIRELDVRNIAKTPVVGDSYKNYALTIKAYNFEISGLATRKLIKTGMVTFSQGFTSSVEEIESDCTSVSNHHNEIPNLKKVVMPKLETIESTAQNFLYGATNPELTYYIPALKTIKSHSSANWCPFFKVVNVVIPPSVTTIAGTTCYNNKTITLNCNRAKSIVSHWCYNTPTENFTMCDDWQANINIATAAKNHTKDWFIDLFQNKLHDFSGEGITREITIPLAIFNQLTAEERAIVENKNWILGGA